MRILVVQTSFLGDVVLSTPVFQLLHERFPSAEIWFMGTPTGVEVVRRDPLIHDVISFDKRAADRGIRGLLRVARLLRGLCFDRAYGMQRSLRTSALLILARIPHRIGFREAVGSWLYHERHSRQHRAHEVLRNVAILGEEALREPERITLRIFPPAEHEISPAVLNALPSSKSWILIAPGSVWYTKRWTGSGYRALAAHYAERNISVVVVGAAREKKLCDLVSSGLSVVNLAGKTSIQELLFLCSRARLVFCNDSFLLHMASATQTPTVTIFCSTTERYGFGPWRNRAEIVERLDLPCKPCGRHGHMKCPTGTEACMRGVAPQTVLAAAERVSRGEL